MHQLLHLMALNRQASGRRFEAVRNDDSGEDEVTLYLYDMIVADALTAEWWGGIDPQTFALELASINASTIHLRINSPGGDVFAARAMEQALKEHPAKIVTHIDGVAASAATYIALAGDEVRMADGAMFMIHNAWTYAAGDKNDLTKTATLLAKIDGTLAKTYADATGKDVKEIAKLMDAETWFTAQEALDYGFADMIDNGDQQQSASNRGTWNMAIYRNAPKPATGRTGPAAEPENIPKPAPEPVQPAALNESDLAARRRRLELAAADI